MKPQTINFFFFWAALELAGAVLLFFLLPAHIKINFSFILSNQASEGSKFYIFTLPAVLFLVTAGSKYLSNRMPYSKWLSRWLLAANLLFLAGTSFYLLQLAVSR